MEQVLADAAVVLGEDAPTAPARLLALLLRTDKLRFRCGMALVEAQKLLSERKLQVLLPKDKDLTELDRTTTQEAGSADATAMVRRLELAQTLLEGRVDLLRYIATFEHKGDTSIKQEPADDQPTSQPSPQKEQHERP